MKPARTIAELLAHLGAKGLVIGDERSAAHVLKTIGYYRLLIYMRALQGPGKQFYPGTSFSDVLDLYRFDRELRLLCLDAIERIEVALRAALVNELAVLYGPHFYLDARHFENVDIQHGFLEKASRADYLAIRHYKARYSDPPVAPIWAVCEAVTFGAISRLYSGLTPSNRKSVARFFGFGEVVLVSWFRTLTDVRNICAHHNRLWDAKLLVNRPMQAKVLRSELTPQAQEKFYGRAVVIEAMLGRINAGNGWKEKLKSLIASRAALPLQEMGFPQDWRTRPLWRQ